MLLFWSIIFVMKRKIIALLFILFFACPQYVFALSAQERAVRKVILSQFKYANNCNFDKFISTYDSNYVNSDGFNLETYSKLVRDIWQTYKDIKYDVEIKNITIKNNNEASVDVTEYTNANLALAKNFTGELDSKSESVYYLKKVDKKWKVISDTVYDETTRMLYGDARNLDIILTVPDKIGPNTEYSATLEFVPPKNTIAIASIAADKVEYPQPKIKEVFRAMPEDNILERLFTSNNDNVNEYVMASIGLTQASVCDLNINMRLTGFGYIIKRVNVLSLKEEKAGEND